MKNKAYETAARLWNMETETLRYMAEVINEKTFTQAVQAISNVLDNGGHILVTGKGATGMTARAFANELSELGYPVVFFEPNVTLLNVIHDRDMVIFVSKGGATPEVVRLLEPAKARGCKIVGITQNPASMLAMMSDIMLRIIVVKAMKESDDLGQGASIALTALLDGIIAALVEYRRPEDGE